MFKKVLFLIVCMSIGLSNAQTKLMIDFSATGGAVQSGYEAYEATHEVANTFDTKTYSTFGKTISITPSWAEGAVPAVMQTME